MLLVLLSMFSTQFNDFDFSAIYRADSAGSRILSFVNIGIVKVNVKSDAHKIINMIKQLDQTI